MSMSKPSLSELRALIERVARLAAADAWADQLNPTQLATLDYLTRANRFSRAPSHVADYLCATRGTVSQTIKALERKGFITGAGSKTDKRRRSYDATDKGWKAVAREPEIVQALRSLPEPLSKGLENGLREILSTLLSRRGGHPYGICKTCKFHQKQPKGAYCQLLEVELIEREPDQICHEYADHGIGKGEASFANHSGK